MDRMREGEAQKIRLYDGGHKRDHFLIDTLGPFVESVPVRIPKELMLRNHV